MSKPDWCTQEVWDKADHLFRCSSADVIALALMRAERRGMEKAAQWHRKNARICREIAQDDPRINESDRQRAWQAAIQHDASATGIETMMAAANRAKAQETTR